jgi:arabinofuranan 3-O-arabinosyltransferase
MNSESASTETTSRFDRRDGFVVAIIAAIAYLPLLLTHWGELNADTKLYLYLDPTGLLRSAPNLWNESWSGGTVTHQNIGYLWPMGPYYAVTNWLGLPDWIAQRIWFGTILFAAAVGAYVCFRTLWRGRWSAVAGAFIYGLSPFVLGHITGQSALLLPFVALPWLLWAVRNAMRGNPWRWAAIAALITTTAGALNGSSIFFVLAGVMLWVPYAVWWERSASVRTGATVLVRLALLILTSQLWWLVAYQVGGQYGQPILHVTETVNQTSTTTSAIEVLRGLGYWFFYGGDHQGAWLTGIAPAFTQKVPLIAVSFAAPFLCLLLGWVSRARERAFFVALIVFGVLMSTISFGAQDRSPAGNLFEALSRQSDLILSLRNTQRAGALVAFGLAGLASCGVAAVRNRSEIMSRLLTGALVVAVAMTFVVPWSSGLIPDRYTRPEKIPRAWIEAGSYLNEVGGRALLVPGADFGAYRWGHTLDPVLAGVTHTELIWREQLPMGGAPGADLVGAFDEALQTGQLSPSAIVPIARALGISHIVLAGDQEWERYRTVRPEQVMATLLDPASGLTLARTFGSVSINQPSGTPIIDNRSLQSIALPEVAIFDVPGVDREPVTATASGAETVLHGDGSGILDAASGGLLDTEHLPILFASELRTWNAARQAAQGPGVRHIVTDTARRSVKRFYTLTANDGATLDLNGRPHSGLASDQPSSDLLAADADSQSIALTSGAAWIDATGYGDLIRLLPEDRPSNAFDGDPNTAWRIDPASFRTLRGNQPNELTIDLGQSIAADHVTVVQSSALRGTLPISYFEVVLDGDRVIPVTVDPALAFDNSGTEVRLGGLPFSTMTIRVPDVPGTYGPIAIAEVKIPGVVVDETIRMPRTLTDSVPQGGPLRLAYVMTRLRVDPSDATRFDPESSLRRLFEVPSEMAFTLSGTIRVDGRASETVLDSAIGTNSTVTATSSARRFGDPTSRASSAIDGDPTTAWVTPLDGAVGATWSAHVPGGFNLNELALDIVADGYHSVPMQLIVTTNGQRQIIDIPAADLAASNGLRRVRLRPSQPLVGTDLAFEIASVDSPDAINDSGQSVVAPVAIAEVNLGPTAVAPDAILPTDCRSDLLTIDGTAVAIALGPTRSDEYLSRSFTSCDGAPIVLSAGEHIVRTAASFSTGLNIDQILLVSPDFATAPTIVGLGAGPVVDHASTDGATIHGSNTSYWVRLNQSSNPGWSATARWNTGSTDLGSAHTLDGFASGWLMDDNTSGQSNFTFTWKPQRMVNIALAVSALTVLACIALCFFPRRRRALRDVVPPRLARDPFRTKSPPMFGSALIVLGGFSFGGLSVGLATAALALATSLGALWRPAAYLARLVPLASIALAVALILRRQALHRFPHDVFWPTQFMTAHSLVLFGLLGILLGVIADRTEDLEIPTASDASKGVES